MVYKLQLWGNFECLSCALFCFIFPFFFAPTPFFKHRFARAAISHRTHHTKKSNLVVCETHEKAICAAYSKIRIRQKGHLLMQSVRVCVSVNPSKSERLFVRRLVCAPVVCMWLMKRNLLMCLHIDISQDLSCSSEKLKPLTFFRLTFPWAAGTLIAGEADFSIIITSASLYHLPPVKYKLMFLL